MTAAGFLALVLSLSSLRLLFPLHAAAFDDRIPALAEAIVQEQSGGDLQHWVDAELPASVGRSSPDWYAMVLSARGYALPSYSAALQTYIAENDIPSGTTRERMALTLCACEPEPPAVCADLLENSAGTTGIMSWIFALHLLNNGVLSAEYTRSGVAERLTALQAPDGGWSLTGDRGDADVTAMTLQALAPYQYEESITPAVERALDFLADTQLSSGAYQSYGTENPESTAQVWTALSALGIDALNDGRFIQNGCTLLDGILQFQVTEGSYAHTLGGEANVMATVQVYLALSAAELQQSNGSVLLFHGQPQWDGTAPPVTEPAPSAQTVPAKTAARTDTGNADIKRTETHTDTTVSETAAVISETHPGTETTASTAQETAAKTTLTTAAAPAAEIILTTALPSAPRSDTEKYPYRIPLTIVSCVIFGGAALWFLVRKNRSPKTYLTLVGGFIVMTALVWCIKIERPEQFYQNEARSGGGTVTMAIRCDVICGLPGSERYPADGVIMPLTEFSISEDENALALLYDAVKAYSLQIEVDGVSSDVVETAYVRGIASLYEFDFGDLSGWTYEVNGERPSVGCGACTLHDGDRVEWIYTINL